MENIRCKLRALLALVIRYSCLVCARPFTIIFYMWKILHIIVFFLFFVGKSLDLSWVVVHFFLAEIVNSSETNIYSMREQQQQIRNKSNQIPKWIMKILFIKRNSGNSTTSSILHIFVPLFFLCLKSKLTSERGIKSYGWFPYFR